MVANWGAHEATADSVEKVRESSLGFLQDFDCDEERIFIAQMVGNVVYWVNWRIRSFDTWLTIVFFDLILITCSCQILVCVKDDGSVTIRLQNWFSYRGLLISSSGRLLYEWWWAVFECLLSTIGWFLFLLIRPKFAGQTSGGKFKSLYYSFDWKSVSRGDWYDWVCCPRSKDLRYASKEEF